MKKVFVTDPWFPERERLEQQVGALGGEVVYSSAPDTETLIREGSDAYCILNSAAKLRPEYIKKLTNCHSIVRTGIGLDTVDIPAASEMGICVCNVPDYCQSEVADHAATLALAIMRRIPRMNAETHAGKWVNTEFGFVPRSTQTTVGLLGFGSIAKNVARRFQGFDMTVMAYDPYLPDEAFAERNVIRAGTVDEIYEKADIVSLHMPLNDETRGMINDEAFAKMKDNVFLVNTARGGLVDQAALCRALASGKVAGAGLDVVEKEPIHLDDPLLSYENVIITPHAAYYSSVATPELCDKIIDEIERTLRGEPNRVVANRKLLNL